MDSSVLPLLMGAGLRQPNAAPVTRLTGQDGAPGFGQALALSGDGQFLLVGAPEQGTSGTLYLFRRQGSAWYQHFSRSIGNDNTLGFGQTVAMSTDAEVFAVSCRSAQGATVVYVYGREGDDWYVLNRLEGLPDEAAGAPARLALSGDGRWLAVGSRSAGTVSLFFAGAGAGAWDAAAVQVEAPADASPAFAGALALSGDGRRLAIGDAGADGGRGRVLLMTCGAGGWAAGALRSQWLGVPEDSPEGIQALGFGAALGLDAAGRWLLVGSPSASLHGLANAGVGYLLRREGEHWPLQQTVHLHQPAAEDGFASAVAFSADASTLLAWVPGRREGNGAPGQVAIHVREQEQLVAGGRLPADADAGLLGALALSADGQVGAAGAGDNAVYVRQRRQLQRAAEVRSPVLAQSLAPQAATAVPVFIGCFRQRNGELASNRRCIEVRSWAEFERHFGASQRTRVTWSDSADTELHIEHSLGLGSRSVQLYFDNGGGRCFILPLHHSNDYGELASLAEKVRQAPAITLLCTTENLGVYDPLYPALAPLLGSPGSPFLIADSPDGQSRPDTDAQRTAVYFPGVATLYPARPDDSQIEVLGYRFTSGQPAAFEHHSLAMIGEQDRVAWRRINAAVQTFFAAHYARVQLKASPAVAACYVHNDRERGVWQAPAGRVLSRVTGLSQAVPLALAKGLLAQRINALQAIEGEGVRVWGGRTQVDPRTPLWLSVATSRLFDATARELQQALQFAVYLPNHPATWDSARSAVQRVLERLWREGGLQGRTREEAFYVQVGSEVSMNAADLAVGRMVVKAGIAVLRPLEFVEILFSQVLNSG